MSKILLVVLLTLPCLALIGCGSSPGEASVPETFAPKPPPEETSGGKKSVMPVESD